MFPVLMWIEPDTGYYVGLDKVSLKPSQGKTKKIPKVCFNFEISLGCVDLVWTLRVSFKFSLSFRIIFIEKKRTMY